MARRPTTIKPGGDWAAYRSDLARLDAANLESLAVARTRRRVRLAICMFTLVFGIFAARLVDLTFSMHAQARAAAQPQITTYARPDIVDRNGRVLATNIVLSNLLAQSAQMENPEQVLSQLQSVLPDINLARFAPAMKRGGTVRLASRLTPSQKQAVLRLGNPHLQFTDVAVRVYPSGATTSHITGFVDVDQKGLAGLEYYINDLTDWSLPIRTTIDLRVQTIMHDVLMGGLSEFQAKRGAAIIMDVANGEVIGLVSGPDYDPNDPNREGTGAHFNNATQGRFELGSVFKIFTVAMGLEFGLISNDMTFDTSEPLYFGKFKTDDVHPQRRPLTPAEVLIYSSNIGSAKIAKLATADQISEFWTRLGLYDDLGLPLLEKTVTQFPARLGEAEQITSSYGHGISTSPMHFLSAAAAIVNGGEYYPPSLFPVDLPIAHRVVSPETSGTLRAMLRQVVERGTGKNGDVEGYYVIGKTGSADKPIVGGYSSEKIIASFVAAFPQDRPRYAVMVMLDEPQATPRTNGFNYAGWNAAPLTARIIERVAPILGVMPQTPELAALSVQAEAMPQIQLGGDDASQ